MLPFRDKFYPKKRTDHRAPLILRQTLISRTEPLPYHQHIKFHGTLANMTDTRSRQLFQFIHTCDGFIVRTRNASVHLVHSTGPRCFYIRRTLAQWQHIRVRPAPPDPHTIRMAGAQFDGWLNIIQRCVVLEDSHRCIYINFFLLFGDGTKSLFYPIIIEYFGPRTSSKFPSL